MKLPGLHILGFNNRKLNNENDPKEAEVEMKQIIDADWSNDFRTKDILDMTAVVNDPTDVAYVNEMRSYDALR